MPACASEDHSVVRASAACGREGVEKDQHRLRVRLRQDESESVLAVRTRRAEDVGPPEPPVLKPRRLTGWSNDRQRPSRLLTGHRLCAAVGEGRLLHVRRTALKPPEQLGGQKVD